MAAIRKYLYTQLQASTMIEAIVAVIISSISFGFALCIYLQIYGSTLSEVKCLARTVMEDEYRNTARDGLYADETYTQSGFTVVKKVSLFQRLQDVYSVNITIYGAAHRKLCQDERLQYAK
jgi:hypothetical protein